MAIPYEDITNAIIVGRWIVLRPTREIYSGQKRDVNYWSGNGVHVPEEQPLKVIGVESPQDKFGNPTDIICLEDTSQKKNGTSMCLMRFPSAII